MAVTLNIPPVLLVKQAVRSLLAGTRSVRVNGTSYQIALAHQVDWKLHTPEPVAPPPQVQSPIPGDGLTLIGEVVCDGGLPDFQPHQQTSEECKIAVVVNATVNDGAALTADDYLDLLAAEIQTVLCLSESDTAEPRTLLGTAKNITYAGFEKRDVGQSLSLRVLIVNFDVTVRYPADCPVAAAVATDYGT